MGSKHFSIQAFWLWAALFLLFASIIVMFHLPAWFIFFICCLPIIFLSIDNPRLFFYGLLIVIPPSIEYAVTDTLSTDLPDEPMIVLCCFLACAGVIWRYGQGEKMRLHYLTVLLLVQLGWQAVTVITSIDLVVSVKFFIAKIWYLGAFILFPLLYLKDTVHIRTAALAFTGSMVACMAWVMMQHIGSGLTFSTINDSVQPFFRNHVNYSVLLVTTLTLTYAFIISVKKGGQKGALIVVLLLLLAALYFSYSRGAWLAGLTGIAAFWLLKKRLLLLGYFAAIALAFSAFFYFAHNDRYEKYGTDFNNTVFHTRFSEHWAATYQMKDLSTAERFYRWIAGSRMVADNWQTGWGPNTFYPAYKEYTLPSFTTWVSDNRERSTVHNYFLLTLIEQGAPGLFLLLLLLAFAFYTVQKVYQRTPDPFWRLAISVSGVILVQLCTVNFLSDLVETDEGGSVFYLCVATIIICDLKTRNLKLPPNI